MNVQDPWCAFASVIPTRWVCTLVEIVTASLCHCCGQYYALGAAAAQERRQGGPAAAPRTALDVYVGVSLDDDSSDAVLRVAEALLHEGLEDIGKRLPEVGGRGGVTSKDTLWDPA